MKIINLFRSAFLDREKQVLFFLFLFFFAAINFYIITPKIYWQEEIYKPGAIAIEDVIVSRDTFLEDQKATQLKLQNSIVSAPVILDFDPAAGEEKLQLAKEIFSEFRSSLSGFDSEIQRIQMQIKRINFQIFDTGAQIFNHEKIIQYHQRYQKEILRLIRSKENSPKKNKLFLTKFTNELQANKVIIAHYLQEVKKQREKEKQLKNTMEREKIALKNQMTGREKETTSLITDLQRELTISIEPEKQQFFYKPFYSQKMEDKLSKILQKISITPLVDHNELLNINLERQAKITDIRNNKTQTVDRISKLRSLKQAKEDVVKLLKNEIPEPEIEPYQEIFFLFLDKLVTPSITLNRSATEQILVKIKEDISPVYVNLKKGQTLVRRGEKITPSNTKLINSYFSSGSVNRYTLRFLGIGLLVFLIFSITAWLIARNSKSRDEGHKNVLIIFLAITLSVVISKSWIILAESFSVSYPDFQINSFYYALPAVLAALLTGVLIRFSVGVFTGLVTAVFISLMLNDSLYIFLFVAGGSAVASFPMANKDSRIGLVKHGLVISAVNMVIALQIFFLQNNGPDQRLFYDLALAFTSGISASFFTLFLLPFFEYIFDITTDLKLLELSNMNHPALKQLMASAPGSYQHSIMVGNLAEAAALKTNANALFCRVASYYHDIGKGKAPEYFIENNDSRRMMDAHRELNDPKQSAQVIINHVKNGRDMVKEYKLGKKIGDIIQEHHGTSLVKFFYVKTKNAAKNPRDVSKKDFRYPGPKPQTLESAIIMLADGCEAAVRCIQNPTPAKIDEMIRKVSGSILQDDQLDQSGISLKQFKDIMETFLNLLVTIYHKRIEYPDEKKRTPGLSTSQIEPIHPAG